MDPRERLAAAARRLASLAGEERPDPEELGAVRAEVAAAERELYGRRRRAARGEGAQSRILAYLKERVGQQVSGDELREISGIHEWARRVRELRVEHGYDIIEEGGSYALASATPDEDAAARWATANEIRRRPGDGRDRILDYLKANVGGVVSLAELHYVARIKEVPRRVRELRDEFGYRISSRHDRPDLRVDQYVLETLDRLPASERQITPAVRAAVLERDGYRCVLCGAVPGPGVWLEVDHIVERADGGSDEPDNLRTLCNRDHAAKTGSYQRGRREARRRRA